MIIEIQVDGDQIDKIIRQELRSILSSFEGDLDTVILSDEELKYMRRDIKALKRVLNLFGDNL